MTLDQPTIDRLAAAPVAPGRLLIDGKWCAGEGGESPVLSPIDGRQLTTLATASAGDVDRACASARAAFEDGRWSRLAPSARKVVLHRLADLIEKHAVDLAVLGDWEVTQGRLLYVNRARRVAWMVGASHLVNAQVDRQVADLEFIQRELGLVGLLSFPFDRFRRLEAELTLGFTERYCPTDFGFQDVVPCACLLYTSPSPRDGLLSRMPSSA